MEVKICPACEEKNNPAFAQCWKCGQPFSGAKPSADTLLLDQNKNQPSIGLKILAWLYIISGITGTLFNYFALTHPLPAVLKVLKYNPVLVSSAMSLISLCVSVLSLCVGINLLTLHELWRRIAIWAAIFMCFYSIASQFFFINASMLTLIGTIPVLEIVALFYLNSKKAKEQFKRTDCK